MTGLKLYGFMRMPTTSCGRYISIFNVNFPFSVAGVVPVGCALFWVIIFISHMFAICFELSGRL